MRRSVSLLAPLALVLATMPGPVECPPTLVRIGMAAVLRGAAEGYASVER